MRTLLTRTRRLAGWCAIGLLIFTYYLGLATRFEYDVWRITVRGHVFNSQVRALLEGRVDIDPRIIGPEGFLRDGKTYTYFGVWPALLRLPLVTQLWRDWTILSCALAATLAALALLNAVTSPIGAPQTRLALLTVATSFILSGPQVELLGKPLVYTEAMLWAYASSCLFISIALPILCGVQITPRRLTALASCAAVALLARVSTGLALYAAFGLLVCALAWRWHTDRLRLRDGIRSLRFPVMLLLSALLVTTAINTLRWGHPLEFAPLHLNGFYAADPARLERLERHGVFALARVPDALTYYAAPAWFLAAPPDSARATRIADLFDDAEGPPIGIPQAQGLWLTLAAVGAWAWATGRAGLTWSRGALAIIAGLAVGPLVIASYHYLAFRYRAEFAPLILFFVLLGLHALHIPLMRAGTPLRTLLSVLFLIAGGVQILQAHTALRAHGCTPMGSYTEARKAALFCLAGMQPVPPTASTAPSNPAPSPPIHPPD